MSNVPKTPPSKCRVGDQLDDPDITPTRHRRYDTFSPALTRRKSWEEEAVVSLADPRELESLAFIDIWRGDFAQSSNDAFKDFRATLRFEFQARPTDHQRMLQATKKDDRGCRNYEKIILEASRLFAGHPDLAHSLNHCLPPGYSLDAAEEYVTVTTPRLRWRQWRDGRLEKVLPSSLLI